jgi:hypothetical protein
MARQRKNNDALFRTVPGTDIHVPALPEEPTAPDAALAATVDVNEGQENGAPEAQSPPVPDAGEERTDDEQNPPDVQPPATPDAPPAAATPEGKKPGRFFDAATVELLPRCPKCGGEDFRRITRQDLGGGYDYRDPRHGYLGKMIGVVRAECKKPGCNRPVLIRQIIPAPHDVDAAAGD